MFVYHKVPSQKVVAAARLASEKMLRYEEELINALKEPLPDEDNNDAFEYIESKYSSFTTPIFKMNLKGFCKIQEQLRMQAGHQRGLRIGEPPSDIRKSFGKDEHMFLIFKSCNLLISLVMIKCNTWRFHSVPFVYWNVVVDMIGLSSSDDACATATSKLPIFP